MMCVVFPYEHPMPITYPASDALEESEEEEMAITPRVPIQVRQTNDTEIDGVSIQTFVQVSGTGTKAHRPRMAVEQQSWDWMRTNGGGWSDTDCRGN